MNAEDIIRDEELEKAERLRLKLLPIYCDKHLLGCPVCQRDRIAELEAQAAETREVLLEIAMRVYDVVSIYSVSPPLAKEE